MRWSSVALAAPLVMCTEQGPTTYEVASMETTRVLCAADEETRERIERIMMTALDHSLQLHVEKMFDGWMKDDYDQPARAKRGVREGLTAYIQARNAVVRWTPMVCVTP